MGWMFLYAFVFVLFCSYLKEYLELIQLQDRVLLILNNNCIVINCLYRYVMQLNPACKNLEVLACHSNTLKYSNLFSQARSSRFLYKAYSKMMISILTKEFVCDIVEIEITPHIYSVISFLWPIITKVRMSTIYLRMKLKFIYFSCKQQLCFLYRN